MDTATEKLELPSVQDPPGTPVKYVRSTMILFILVHLIAVAGVIVDGWSWSGVVLALSAYYARMILVTAGYHRYFSHRSFRTSRVFQFLLAVATQSAAQNGVIWWASHHRWHHRHSDTPLDVHSVKQRGFWYSHVGWILQDAWKTDLRMVPDLAKYPELRLLDRPGYQFLPPALLGLAFLLIGGVHGLVWGFMVSTVLLWHGSFAINSLTHMFGRPRYVTHDNSRNHWLLALITTGEGWHNNHHHYASSAKQGFFWWEIDPTYWVLRVWQMVGLIHDLRCPPAHVLAGPLVIDAKEDRALLGPKAKTALMDLHPRDAKTVEAGAEMYRTA